MTMRYINLYYITSHYINLFHPCTFLWPSTFYWLCKVPLQRSRIVSLWSLHFNNNNNNNNNSRQTSNCNSIVLLAYRLYDCSGAAHRRPLATILPPQASPAPAHLCQDYLGSRWDFPVYHGCRRQQIEALMADVCVRFTVTHTHARTTYDQSSWSTKFTPIRGGWSVYACARRCYPLIDNRLSAASHPSATSTLVFLVINQDLYKSFET